MSLSEATPSYLLFASAGKHAMDYALHFKRCIATAADATQAKLYTEAHAKWRAAAWDHIAAAKFAKARALA